VHPGASYLHAGQTWRVTALDLDGRTAVVEPDDGTTYTVARTDIDIRIVRRDATRRVGKLEVGLGTVEVHEQVTGYQRKDALTGESLGMTALELPRSTEDEKQRQLQRLADFHDRHAAERPAMLDRLRDAALAGDNLFAVLMDAVRVCSLGEITQALFDVGGRYRRNV